MILTLIAAPRKLNLVFTLNSIHFAKFSYLKIFFPLLDIIQNNEFTMDFTYLLDIMTTTIIAIIISTIINVNAELFRVP